MKKFMGIFLLGLLIQSQAFSSQGEENPKYSYLIRVRDGAALEECLTQVCELAGGDCKILSYQSGIIKADLANEEKAEAENLECVKKVFSDGLSLPQPKVGLSN